MTVDPFAYAADIKAHPENYCSVASIVACATAQHHMRHAPDLPALKKVFGAAWKAAGDAELQGALKTTYEGRKVELSKISVDNA